MENITNEQISEYIRSARAKGRNIQDIKSELYGLGYHDDEIEEALSLSLINEPVQEKNIRVQPKEYTPPAGINRVLRFIIDFPILVIIFISIIIALFEFRFENGYSAYVILGLYIIKVFIFSFIIHILLWITEPNNEHSFNRSFIGGTIIVFVSWLAFNSFNVSYSNFGLSLLLIIGISFFLSSAVFLLLFRSNLNGGWAFTLFMVIFEIVLLLIAGVLSGEKFGSDLITQNYINNKPCYDKNTQDIYIKGKITLDGKEFFDSCIAADSYDEASLVSECMGERCYVVKYSCSYADLKKISICSNGCSDGACLNAS